MMTKEKYTRKRAESTATPDHMQLLRILRRMANTLDTDSLLALVQHAAKLREAA